MPLETMIPNTGVWYKKAAPILLERDGKRYLMVNAENVHGTLAAATRTVPER